MDPLKVFYLDHLRSIHARAETPTSLVEGNTYRNYAASPFPLQGKTNASSRSSRKNFQRRCQRDLRQVKTYQVLIINSHLLHYIIRHSPLIFLSPTSKIIFKKIYPFLRPSSIRLLVCFLFACVLDCLLCHDGSR